MNLYLANKVILVTGGAKGIGEGIVNVLAAEGTIPVVVGRNWPISDAGPRIAAHLYNSNMKRHRGKLEAVLNGKILTSEQQKCMVWESSAGSRIRSNPSSGKPIRALVAGTTTGRSMKTTGTKRPKLSSTPWPA